VIELSENDKNILELLSANARQSARNIAATLDLSPSFVSRRIAYLEGEGVIDRYTVVINHGEIGRQIEAYLLLTVDIQADLDTVLSQAQAQPGVRETSTLAGDPDALIRLRVNDAIELRDTVLRIRKLKGVTGTKTLVALDRTRHIQSGPFGDRSDGAVSG
jgi:DNA-binding Lrp family transcriptional regulator